VARLRPDVAAPQAAERTNIVYHQGISEQAAGAVGVFLRNGASPSRPATKA